MVQWQYVYSEYFADCLSFGMSTGVDMSCQKSDLFCTDSNNHYSPLGNNQDLVSLHKTAVS